jgi:hypothetical protein
MIGLALLERMRAFTVADEHGGSADGRPTPSGNPSSLSHLHFAVGQRPRLLEATMVVEEERASIPALR